MYTNDHQEMDLLLKNNIWITFPVEYEQWHAEEDKKYLYFSIKLSVIAPILQLVNLMA